MADAEKNAGACDDSGRDEPTDARGDLVVASRELFQGRSEVLIEHAGELYRLRITKTGKLILNK